MDSSSEASSSRLPSPVVQTVISEEEEEIWSPPDQEVLDDYNSLMSTLLPPIKTPQQQYVVQVEETIRNEDGSLRPMTKAEKQNAKKKRRKERERDERAEVVKATREELEKEQMARPVSFRLFSSCPIKEVSLLPSPEDYRIPENPRHVPLSPEISRRIHVKVSEAAVSFPFDNPTFPPIRRKRRRIDDFQVTPQGTSVRARLFIAQTSKTPVKAVARAIPKIQVQDRSIVLVKKRQRSKRPKRLW